MTVLFCFAEAGTFWGAQPGLRFGLMIRPQSRKCWGADVGCRVELSSFFLRHDGVTEVGVLESRRLGKVSLTGDLWACGKFGHCGGLNRYGPQSLMCLNAWSRGVALLGGATLLEGVLLGAGFEISEMQARPRVIFSSCSLPIWM